MLVCLTKKHALFLPMSSLTCMRISGMFGLTVKSKMIPILKINFKKSFKSKVCWKSPGNKATPVMLRFSCPCLTYFSFWWFKKIIYSPLAALSLLCCAWAFSGCSEQGLLWWWCTGFSSQRPLVEEHRLSGVRALVVVACGLRSCGAQVSSCDTRA